jgi:SAM-dependent methyltransferase
MNWRLKALTSSILSLLPGGERLHYLCQRRITKTLPTPDEAALARTNQALEQLEILGRHGCRSVGDATLYEFGAGADLLVPLTYWMLGAGSQILIDRNFLARRELINHTVAQLRSLRAKIGAARGPSRPCGDDEEPREFLREAFSIDHRAPVDAAHTGLGKSTVDYVTSTNTLEHIPAAAIPGVLRECRRIIRPEGVACFRIDYRDHYSDVDSKISIYNFLRYPDLAWRLYNSTLHYQNRLRHHDYLALIESAGFKVIQEIKFGASAANIELVHSMRLAAQFRLRYTPEQLAVSGALLSLRPA